MYRIAKEFKFEAAHQLRDMPEGHQCARLHGHSYVVVLELTGNLDKCGFVVDFGDLAPFKRFIDDNLDHKYLNDLLPQPTAENLAAWLYAHTDLVLPDLPEWAKVTAVRVHETVTSWAEYRP